jgi:FKBP-type peptidyl-prolyl cis-trans isomerase
LSCAGASFHRETRAFDGRTDDLWLEGERCPAGTRDDAGLRIEEVEAGSGQAAADGETVRVHYIAKLPDGTVVHDTLHNGAPIEIIIGSTKMICGFDRAVLGMRAGEQRRVFVPWRLAFGEDGRPPDVPPRTDLVFVIDLFVPAYREVDRGSAPVNPAARGRRR